MGGFNDNDHDHDHAGMQDWMPPSPSPSPRFYPAMFGEDTGSRLGSGPEPPKDDGNHNNSNGFTFPGPESQIGPENGDGSQRGQPVDDGQAPKPGAFGEQKTGPRSGLVERMAARAGHNAPRLNTDIMRPANVSQNQETRSPYLTIPPGLSPTTLLDSPVFLSNSLVQPSPTTGKFQFAPNGNGNGKSSMMFSESSDRSKDSVFENFNGSSFAFKPEPGSAPLFRGYVDPPFMSRQSFPTSDPLVQPEKRFAPQNIEPAKVQNQNGASVHLHSDLTTEKRAEAGGFPLQATPFGAVNSNAERSQQHQGEDPDQRAGGDNGNVNSGSSEDGYNWRKYGQKQVKGSEYPRSYYKCTHPNCPVKKKVERSQEGHVTEIIYKGAHNHPKLAPSRRSGIGPSGDVTEQGGGVDGDPVWAKRNGVWAHDGGLEVLAAAVPHGQTGGQFDSGDAVDGSSTFSNEEEEDDRATHGSVSLGYDGEGDETESKRRKVEAYAADVSGATRAIREPRVVVQTTSEVDILDDGYRWRKYGQKVVKGNPNPRSYYKCTSAGCTVRKHVERASHDLKSVITTYEGKHNHDVPVARNTGHANSNNANAATAQSQVHRPGPSQFQNHMARFDGPPYGLPGNHQQMGYGFGMGQAAHMGMAGLGPNQGKPPMVSVDQYLGQPRQMHEMGFMLPKGEPKLELVSDPGLNLANGAPVYHQMMNRLPLGPQM